MTGVHSLDRVGKYFMSRESESALLPNQQLSINARK